MANLISWARKRLCNQAWKRGRRVLRWAGAMRTPVAVQAYAKGYHRDLTGSVGEGRQCRRLVGSECVLLMTPYMVLALFGTDFHFVLLLLGLPLLGASHNRDRVPCFARYCWDEGRDILTMGTELPTRRSPLLSRMGGWICSR